MRKYSVFVAIGLGIVVSLKLFCSSGRYQIAFGNIQQGYKEWGKNRTEENRTVPVCIKIDTFTGKCWIYQNNFTVYATGEIGTEEGFQKIPKYKASGPLNR